MRIKVQKTAARKVTGIPECEVAAVAQTDGRIAQVTVSIKAIDAYEMGSIIATIRMSPEEARSLAYRVTVGATDAEVLLQKERTVSK